jgi:hypothetical protein
MIFRTMDAKLIPTWDLAGIAELALREEDRQELIALTGGTPGKALIEAVHAAGQSWVTFDINQRRLIGVFGVHESRLLRGGVIWAVLTPDVYNCIKEFNKVSAAILDHWLNKYGVLHNYVDTRNEAHIRWLKHLGFTFPQPNDVLFNDVWFRYFQKEK